MSRTAVQHHRHSIRLVGGSTGRIDSAKDVTLATSVYTMGGWVKQTLDTTTTYEGMFAIHNSTTGTRSSLLARILGNDQYGYFDNQNGVKYFGVTPRIDTWEHVMVTVSQTSAKLYINAVLKATVTLVSHNSDFNGYSLGADNGSASVEARAGSYGKNIFVNWEMTQADVERHMKLGKVTNNGVETQALIDWQMSDGTGSTVTDTGSSSLNGTIQAGGTWTNDKPMSPRKAVLDIPYTLNTSAGRMDIGTGVYQFERTDSFSFAMKLKTSSSKITQNLFVEGNGSSPYTGIIYRLNNRKPLLLLINSFTGNTLGVQTTNPLPLNKWVDLVVTYDGSSTPNGINFYVNGEIQAKNTVYNSLSASIVYATGVSRWFQSGTGGGDPFVGSATHMRVFNYKLSQSEIDDLYIDGQVSGTRPLDEYLTKEGTDIMVESTGTALNVGTLTSVNWTTDSNAKSRTAITTRRQSARDYHGSVCLQGVAGQEIDSGTSSKFAVTDFTLSTWIYNIENKLTFEGAISVNDGTDTVRGGLLPRTSGGDLIKWSDPQNGVVNFGYLAKNQYRKWVNWIVTFDTTNLEAKLYRDGVKVGNTITIVPMLSTAFDRMTVGNYRHSGGELARGYFSESFMADWVMTANDVADYYFDNQIKNNGVETAPVVRLEFSNGSGTSVTDISGNGLDGTILGAGTWSDNTPFKARPIIT